MSEYPDLDLGATIRGFAAGQRVFRRYSLLRLLGRGGMGVVWLARDEELEREVALKFLPELLASDKAAIAELKRETRRSLELTHPNIVRVYDFVQDARLAAISMEYIDGRTLADLRTERPGGAFDPADLAPWLAQLAGALDYAHREALVVHRDLKPANVMVDARGRIKITDFGISATVSDTVTRATRLTDSTSGTLPYMSPQQMLGRPPAPADDIYSLGALLYELLTSKPPFFRGNIAVQIERETPPPMAERRREFGLPAAAIPDDWERAIAHCLQKETTARPASAAEALAKMAPASATAKNSGPPAAALPRPVSRLRWAAPLIVVALLGAAGAGYYFGYHLPQQQRREAAAAQQQAEAGQAEEARLAELARAVEEETQRRLAGERAAEEARLAEERRLQQEAEVARLAAAQRADDERRAEETRLAELRRLDEQRAQDEQERLARESALAAQKTRDTPSSRAEEPPPAPPPEFVIELDPVVPGARAWLGPRVDLAIGADGRLVLRDLPPGEHELMVQAPGHQMFNTRVRMGSTGGGQRVTLAPLRAGVAVRARPGTRVIATGADGRAIVLATIGADGLWNEGALSAGRYTLRFEHPDCEPVEEAGVDLVAGRARQFTPAQRPLPAELTVTSQPEGALVRIDGVDFGVTPARGRTPSEAPLRIEITRAGYRRATEQLTLRPRESRVFEAGQLVAEAGALSLGFSAPDFRVEQARFLIDGREIPPVRSGGGWRLDGLAPGERTLEVVHRDYEPSSQRVVVIDGATTSATVQMQPRPAAVLVQVDGAAEFAVAIDGQPAAIARGAVQIPAGRDVKLTLTARGFRPAERVFRLAPNATETWSIALDRLDRPVAGEAFQLRSPALAMVWLPPGEFVMGSSLSESGPGSDEQPQTEVRLTRGFWLGATEVTQRQWVTVMGSNPSYFHAAGDNAPVESVSWDDAMEFCRRLTQRENAAERLPAGYVYSLPTEAQWEYACRAGTSGRYAGDLAALAWTSVVAPKPVAQKAPNGWGLYDMHGNVAEWTASWYGGYPGGRVSDYAGPSSASVRVFRGGAWDSNARSLRCAYRNYVSPRVRDFTRGFRVALVAR